MATPKQQNQLYQTTSDRFVEDQYNQTPQLGSVSKPANDAPVEYYPSRVQNATSNFVSNGQKPKKFAANSNFYSSGNITNNQPFIRKPATKSNIPNTNPALAAKAMTASFIVASWSSWLWLGVILICIFEAVALAAAAYASDSWLASAFIAVTTWWNETPDPMSLFYFLWFAQMSSVVIILIGVYINYKAFQINPISGNGGGNKTGMFLLTSILCLAPIAAIIPWYWLWLWRVTIYPK